MNYIHGYVNMHYSDFTHSIPRMYYNRVFPLWVDIGHGQAYYKSLEVLAHRLVSSSIVLIDSCYYDDFVYEIQFNEF